MIQRLKAFYLRWRRDPLGRTFFLAEKALRRLSKTLPDKEFEKGIQTLESSKFEMFPVLRALPDLSQYKDQLKSACMGPLSHQYNILGKTKHCSTKDKVPSNTLPSAYSKLSKYYRSKISEDFPDLEWQLDFKSGFKWNAHQISAQIKYGNQPRVDIKVPWEFGRLQHLVPIALLSATPGTTDNERDRLRRYYLDTVYSFMSSNPYMHGVQWVCTMDVAMRLASILIAYDFFVLAGVKFSNSEEQDLANLSQLHCRFIVKNFEWQALGRSNHYLANICGLLVGAAHLRSNHQARRWLRLASEQLEIEVLDQFFPDGSNRECSTAYHRLSAEMVQVAITHYLAIPETERESIEDQTFYPGLLSPRLQLGKWPGLRANRRFVDRLWQMAEASQTMTKPSGAFVQIGDNDSGRFWKPDGRDHDLNQSHIAQTRDALFGQPLKEVCLGAMIVQAQENYLPQTNKDHSQVLVEYPQSFSSALTLHTAGMQYSKIVFEENLASPLDLDTLDDFGLYVFRSQYQWYSIYCRSIPLQTSGSHAHNDYLHFETCGEDQGIARDPGSYIYTPDHKTRNNYRSYRAHNSPHIDGFGEPNSLDRGIFAMVDEVSARVCHASNQGFIGRLEWRGETIYRIVTTTHDTIRVQDYATRPLQSNQGRIVPFSPAYGVIESA